MSARTGYLPLNLFDFFPNLEKLYIFNPYTKMSAPKDGHFYSAEKLTYIVINNQRLVELGSKVFEGAPNLLIIKLDNNEIGNVDEKLFLNLNMLQGLSISGNQLRSVPEKLFSTLESLKSLDLSLNMISSLPKAAFDENRMLQKIKLSRNRLLQIPHFTLAERTSFELTDSFCIDKIFEKTTELNEYTQEHCNNDGYPFDIVTSYRVQNEINEICEDKRMLETLQERIEELQNQKVSLNEVNENLEFEILKTKIYKAKLC